MAELLTLARPYAKAAFAYAAEHHTEDKWSSDLAMLGATVQDAAFSAYISSPELTPAQKVKSFVNVLGAEQTTVAISNFLTLLAENDRLALLPDIAAEYELLKAQGNNTLDVVIESAYPLSSVQEQMLVSRLEKRFARSVNAKVEIKPELIAGVVIRAGDEVIDDSALNKLEKMRTRLLAQ
ncbi:MULTISPECIES: F0F1 ATP synthase subunit delta [unclassified Acinetobacter]|uniref:F0F1 ATP synthase subunit delta n=1 Tax=unclassified Acinetobacter TaxID=196816 RepID=UPI0035B71495